jgi:hypothetical protein
MTTYLDWRTEPIMHEIPLIDEYVGPTEWSATCTALNCKWVAYGERTENFIEEMAEDVARHREWHENGCPQE